jgi:hypothetical protein
MIILLSPAKTMNLKYPQKDFHCFYLEDALKPRYIDVIIKNKMSAIFIPIVNLWYSYCCLSG